MGQCADRKDESAGARHDQAPPTPVPSGKTSEITNDIDPRITAEIASYIGKMSLEMSVMAKRGRLGMLAYFLDMARIEAQNIERRYR
jgi:hypothetical protein